MSDPRTRLTCPHGKECGACALLGVDYAEQLRGKQDVLGRTLTRYARLQSAKLLPCLPSPLIAGYRNRAKMAVGLSRHGGGAIGYFRTGTREIVDAVACGVLVPELLETTQRLREFLLTAKNVPRELRHIDVRCGDDPKRQHLILVFRAAESPRIPIERLRKVCPKVDGISINLNPSSGPQVLRGPILHLWGAREVWVTHARTRMRVSPGSFFQANLAMLPAVHERMAAFLEGGRRLADLYAGVGTHGLALREAFGRVLFVEGTRSAIGDLKATVRAHGIGNADIVPASVERSLEKIGSAAPDAIVLNPARTGAEASVLAAVAASPAKKIAYLSCEPVTLARDLDLLGEAGFETVSVQPIDMMPQTRQVEALALLRRTASANRPTVVVAPRDTPAGRPASPRRSRDEGAGRSTSPRTRRRSPKDPRG